MRSGPRVSWPCSARRARLTSPPAGASSSPANRRRRPAFWSAAARSAARIGGTPAPRPPPAGLSRPRPASPRRASRDSARRAGGWGWSAAGAGALGPGSSKLIPHLGRTTMPRILSVWSPTWPIATWRRKHPSRWPVSSQRDGAFEAAPFALIATERGVRRLYAVDEAAAALGLFAGQKATDAMALVPELTTDEADPAGDLAALEALVLWCVRYSPAVALDPPDGLFLDITGVAHLWGGEAAMLDDLLGRLGAQGVPACGAVAGSAGAAWALARCGEDRTVAPPGAEAEFLAPLPVTGLRLEPQ